MRVFDLHCDTITACMRRGEEPATATGHIALPMGRYFEAWTQVFAVFVPDTLQEEDAAAHCDNACAWFEARREQWAAACTPILALENGSALAGDLARIDALAAHGVRIITLTWNGANALGFGAACDPARGLTKFGKDAVRRMFALGIFPDVSHLNPAGFDDVAKLWQAQPEPRTPFLATHSNCAAVHGHQRNLSDHQLRTLFACGGLVGLNLYRDFLGGEGAAADLARHLAHVIALGGGAHVALGSDFDGCNIHPSLAGLAHLPALYEALQRQGFGRASLEAFFGDNAACFFSEKI